MSDIYQVITPENVEIDYEIAGIGSRFLALVIDITIQGILISAFIMVLRLLNLEALPTLNININSYQNSIISTIIITMLAIISLGYYIILETVMHGQTIGKKLLNIRVRKEQGYAPTFWDILLRNLIRPIDFFIFYSIGFLVMFFSKNSKRLGDYAAGTIVVKEIPLRKINKYFVNYSTSKTVFDTNFHSTNQFIERYPWWSPVINSLTHEDYYLIKNLLNRRPELTNYPKLANILVNRLINKAQPEIGPHSMPVAEADQILRELIRAYEQIHSL
ncbi:MAG TPA: RDD family protein [Bacillota bacterium]|nr:RDD family protein [Bacillota bacterium]HOL09207.1 RDD family protein [Bacillota bacterium]HPO97031.1 RDD family protein [Bacillota bacterium]